MESVLNKILGAEGIDEEVQTQLQEAFDKKLTEAKQKIQEETELRLREEFAHRYEHDKGELVEAMDRMLTDVITKHAEEQIGETKELKEARGKYISAVKESRSQYRSKMTEHMTVVRRFVLEQMTKEIGVLRNQQKALAETKTKVDKDLKGAKKLVAEKFAAHRRKIDEFVINRISNELKEFSQDHQHLIDSRVRLVAESRHKLKETQRRFIKESAKLVDGAVTSTLKREMTQLHEDLERNRQNMFGRRIFEAISAEFMSSYLSEGTATKKLQKVLESKAKEMSTIKSQLSDSTKLLEAAKRKTKLAEEQTIRGKTMHELLSNLARDKRAMMTELLETVKTQHLREAFNKYLPTLTESGRKLAPTKKPLNEIARDNEKRTVSLTGNQRPNALIDTDQSEQEQVSSETLRLIRLAGIGSR